MYTSVIARTGLISLLTASTTLALPCVITEKRQAPCTDTHIFLARGNNEPYPGRQGTLVDTICSGLASCDYEDIMYDAPKDSNYCAVVSNGDRNGTIQMNAYVQRCPNSQLVLSGFSQGANIVGDLLGGPGGRVFDECDIDPLTPLDPAVGPGSQIAAILLFGDVQHVADQPYNYLNGSAFMSSSPRPAESLGLMNRFSSIMRNYCNNGDPICATESPAEVQGFLHLNYFEEYSYDAAAFVKGLLRV